MPIDRKESDSTVGTEAVLSSKKMYRWLWLCCFCADIISGQELGPSQLDDDDEDVIPGTSPAKTPKLEKNYIREKRGSFYVRKSVTPKQPKKVERSIDDYFKSTEKGDNDKDEK